EGENRLMEFDLVRTVPDQIDLVVEGVTPDDVPQDTTVTAAGFEGKDGQSVLLPGRLLVGLGSANGDDSVRRAAAVAARVAARCTHVATTLPASQALAEGFELGAYQFNRYRSKPKPNTLERVTVVGGGGARATAALNRGKRVAEAVALARDLVNEPG